MIDDIRAQPGAAPDRFARHLAQKFLGSNALAAGERYRWTRPLEGQYDLGRVL